MQFFYSDTFNLNLPDGHRFPATKYGMLRRALVEDAIVSPYQLTLAEPLADEAIARVHDPAYVASIREGTIDPKAMRRIGFPWTPQIPTRSAATLGGALSAAHAALEDGLSGQLAGGTHHAHYDFGAGYCVYNDFAVVAKTLLAEGRVERIAIIDLDVHQGDGNATMMGDDKRIFILSVHGEKNFPFRKFDSTLDVALPDGTGDRAYLAALEAAMPAVRDFRPDLILYQAGVDPLAEDRLGRLNLSFQGLMDRDRMVLHEARERAIPVSMAIGGGYSEPIALSVEAYANTYRVARSIHGW